MANLENHRAGFVALFGLPNAGKSSLMNAFLGERLAIITPKAQTTRQSVRGVLNRPAAQIVFVDTPGMPVGTLPAKKKVLLSYLQEEAMSALEGVDAVLYVIDAERGVTSSDAELFQQLKGALGPHQTLMVLLNKEDAVRAKGQILTLMEDVSQHLSGVEMFPVSARTKEGMDRVIDALESRLPLSPPLYPADQVSDRNERFLAAEMIRERIFFEMSEEVPYSSAVHVETFKESESLIRLAATIYVERESQKGMLIGKGGSKLKSIGQKSRERMEAYFGKKVFLETHVKVLPSWSRDPEKMRMLGYEVEP